jgi:hypothetical protein
MSPWRVVRRPLSEAALRPARWRASSCRPKLGGALKTSHPPPRQRPSAAPCWPIRRRGWSREHRASCGSRMRGPSGPRARASASSAALRSTRRASAAFKRGASQGALESRRRSLALSQARQKIVSSLHSLAITFWRPLRQSAGRLGVSPSHRRSTGSCHRARCRSTARRSYLDASVVEVVLGELEHVLLPLGRALAPRHRFEVRRATGGHVVCYH